jgi:septal ring factor EnvC (AmiA/AmiB activator)
VTSTDGNKEREIIKEMNFIKESRQYIEEIERLKDIIYKNKKTQYEVGKGLKDLKEEANKLKSRINELKKSQDEK